MARQSALVAENNFIAGLVTETTAIKFPANACTETFDCVFDETGRVTRRLGFDIEENAVLEVVSPASTDVFTEFVWQAAGGNGDINLLVQQQGATLHFYDLSDSLDVSANKATYTVDLASFEVTGTSRSADTEQCQYTVNTGNLIVVNRACDPILVVYDATSNDITSTAIELKQRDFVGVDDGLTLLERPASTVGDLITNNPEHYYNLLNQGWYLGSDSTAGVDEADVLAQWDAARADLPSNADTVGMFRASETAAFGNSNVQANSPGNRPAPKGHFILDVAAPDRTQAMDDDGFTAVLGLTGTRISQSAHGGTIGNMQDMDEAFNGVQGSTKANQNGAWVDAASVCWVGCDYGGTPRRILSGFINGSSDQGYAVAEYFTGGAVNFTGSATAHLYASNSLPSNAFDGTLLGTDSFSDSNNQTAGRTIINVNDTDTFYRYVWCAVDRDDSAAQTWLVPDVFFTEVTGTSSAIPTTTERPTTVCSFAGRVFYAGINDRGLNSSIFFTQVIENNDQYPKCYQVNDPTSEQFFDLLPSDGGVIKIPEIGTVTKLFPYQSSLIIIANNGVWRVSGGSGAFAANDYQIRKLSSTGSDAALSFADYKGLPIWWAIDGINTLQYDPNYDSFAVVSITDATIKSFILDIPETNRRFVKGCFDQHNDTVYWLYSSDASITSTEYYIYDRVLVMNGISKAFYPWTIGDGEEQVRGISYVSEGARSQLSRIKYTITDGTAMSFAETTSTSYTDWPQDDDVDYTSYLITGYRLDAAGIKFFQSNYVWVFMEEEADASCFMQGIWDWTTSSSTGKWSTLQQIYNNTYSTRVMRFRRLKVRGKGKALQLRFESETGKPFTIVGWAIKESANADV